MTEATTTLVIDGDMIAGGIPRGDTMQVEKW